MASMSISTMWAARHSKQRSPFCECMAGLSDQDHVEIKAVALYLSLPETAVRILEIVNGLDIGLLVYNAASSAVGPFLEKSLDGHLKEIDTNVRAPLKLVYLFGERMARR